eukprot:TRINITY_DN12903_c0_g1_i1.p1 TRINITY_DN12903_c0_g1~~TRINITY_DN12903_c0_g1_i1.p1  ORF type:complete len:321 (+),score=64.67 TRINITY_DN12903_c0_g1_i1:23-964(+)
MHAHFSKEPEKLKTVEKHSEYVTRVMGHNPGPFTLQGSNTYLIGKTNSKVLLDSGEGKEEWSHTIEKELSGGSISKILVSHWHPDHVGGLKHLKKMDCCKNAVYYKKPEPYHDTEALKDAAEIDFQPLAEGDAIELPGGGTLKALHTPGHTTDHICFYLEEEDTIFTGDIVLGTGSSHFSDLSAYMATLKRLLGICTEATKICPAHGPVVLNGKAKIEEYISHREARDVQILANIDGNTAHVLVAKLYKDVPEHLHKAAETNIILHLLKLETEGKVTADRTPHEDLSNTTPPPELHDIFHLVMPNLKTIWNRV